MVDLERAVRGNAKRSWRSKTRTTVELGIGENEVFLGFCSSLLGFHHHCAPPFDTLAALDASALLRPAVCANRRDKLVTGYREIERRSGRVAVRTTECTNTNTLPSRVSRLERTGTFLKCFYWCYTLEHCVFWFISLKWYLDLYFVKIKLCEILIMPNQPIRSVTTGLIRYIMS